MVCGRCGAPLRSLARQGGGRSYACRKGPGLRGCGRLRIQAPAVETYVRDLVCGMLADPVTRQALAKLTLVDEVDVVVPAAMAETEARRERLIDLYTEGDIDRETFRARQRKLDEEVRKASAGIQGGDEDVVNTIPSSFE